MLAFDASYQDFGCRQSLRVDDALQSLEHQCQNFTAVSIFLTSY